MGGAGRVERAGSERFDFCLKLDADMLYVARCWKEGGELTWLDSRFEIQESSDMSGERCLSDERDRYGHRK